MLDTVWRVSEIDFDVIEFCKLYRIENVKIVFIQGEEGRRGKINKKSGFNAEVSDTINSIDHVAEIESFICCNADALNHLKSNGISSVFNIGCFVDTNHEFTKSINLPSGLLGLVHKYGIDIEFSSYPTTYEGGDV